MEVLIPATRYSSIPKGKAGRCDPATYCQRARDTLGFCVLTPRAERSRAACLGVSARKLDPGVARGLTGQVKC